MSAAHNGLSVCWSNRALPTDWESSMAKTSTTVAISPGMLVTLIVLSLGAFKGGEWGVERYRNGKGHVATPTGLVERLAIVETVVESQVKALDRIERKLDRVLEGR